MIESARGAAPALVEELMMQRGRRMIATVVLWISAVLPYDSVAEDAPQGQSACAQRTLSVLVFNIEYGGALVDFGKVLEAIRRSDADVVAIEEAWGNTGRLAQGLGWTEYDLRTQVLARLPLIAWDGERGSHLSLAEVTPGCVVVIGNVHLPSDPSAQEMRERGGTGAEVLTMERQYRLTPLEPVLHDLQQLSRSTYPAFLAGDFNAGSHLDDGFAWPTSLAVEAAGFRDSYRVIHPDPLMRRGFTWWAARPPVQGWNPDPHAAQRRIDFLYAAGPVDVRTSRLLGERGGIDVDIAVEPWVSDHRAIVSSFTLHPVRAPDLVSVLHQRAVTGEKIPVRVHSNKPGSQIRLLPARAMAGAIAIERPVPDRVGISLLQIDAPGIMPGEWQALLVDAQGATQAQARFWISEPGAAPGVALAQTHYREGEAIRVRWRDSPANRWDWVGVYSETADPAQGNPLLWQHTQSRVSGEAVLDATVEGDGWPLPAGAYRVVLALDDSYEVLAAQRFLIVAP